MNPLFRPEDFRPFSCVEMIRLSRDYMCFFISIHRQYMPVFLLFFFMQKPECFARFPHRNEVFKVLKCTFPMK